MRIGNLLLAALALCLQATACLAETKAVTVGTKTFTLPTAAGFCIADDNNFKDAQFINVVRTLLKNANNKLLMLTIECERQKTWRAGVAGRITRYATFYLPTPLENTDFPGDRVALRASLCQEMRQQNDATLSSVPDAVAKAAKEMNTKLSVNSTKMIGVLGEDAHGCYTGILINATGPDNKSVMMSGVITSTILDGKALFAAIYNEYQGSETVQNDVTLSKALAAELDKANP